MAEVESASKWAPELPLRPKGHESVGRSNISSYDLKVTSLFAPPHTLACMHECRHMLFTEPLHESFAHKTHLPQWMDPFEVIIG